MQSPPPTPTPPPSEGSLESLHSAYKRASREQREKLKIPQTGGPSPGGRSHLPRALPYPGGAGRGVPSFETRAPAWLDALIAAAGRISPGL